MQETGEIDIRGLSKMPQFDLGGRASLAVTKSIERCELLQYLPGCTVSLLWCQPTRYNKCATMLERVRHATVSHATFRVCVLGLIASLLVAPKA